MDKQIEGLSAGMRAVMSSRCLLQRFSGQIVLEADYEADPELPEWIIDPLGGEHLDFHLRPVATTTF